MQENFPLLEQSPRPVESTGVGAPFIDSDSAVTPSNRIAMPEAGSENSPLTANEGDEA
jgi:hypothetical protein